MIARIIKGAGFRGLLAYLADRPGAERIGGDMIGATPRELAREFALVRRLRPDLDRAVFHLPLRLPPGESLTDDQWNTAARRFLAGLGFADSPYVLYRHADEHGQHVHLVASRITYAGKVVSESQDYFAAMRIARDLERHFGLRIVPYQPEVRRPPAAELHGPANARGATSARRYLQSEVDRAAQAPGSLDRFLDRLAERGVELLPAATSTGHVHGVSYRARGVTLSGGDLGAAFTWPALARRLGSAYQPDRDLPSLLAPRRQQKRKETPMSDPVSPATPLAPYAAAAADRAAQQVTRHLAALGGPTFDVRVLGPAGSVLYDRPAWTADQVLHAVPWLKGENARGAEILIRPADPAVTHLTAVDSARLIKARRAGFEPAAVVRLQRGEREVWLRFAEPLTAPEQAAAGQALQRRFGGVLSPPAAYGHLAGFTSPAAQRAQGLSRRPFAGIEAEAGQPFARSADLLRDARAQLATAAELDALGPQRADLLRDVEADLRRSELGPPAMPPDRQLAEQTSAAWLRARDDHAAALAAMPGVTPAGADALAERLTLTCRELRHHELRLEQLTNFSPRPIHLRPAAFADYAMHLDALRHAEAARDAATPPRIPEQAAWLKLALELEQFAAANDLRPLAPPAAAPEPGRVGESAAAPATPPPAAPAPSGALPRQDPLAPPPAEIRLGGALHTPPVSDEIVAARAAMERDYHAASERLRLLAYGVPDSAATGPGDPAGPAATVPGPADPAAAAPPPTFAEVFTARARAELQLEHLEADLRRSLHAVSRGHDRLAIETDIVEQILSRDPRDQDALDRYRLLVRDLTVGEDRQLAVRTQLEAVESRRLQRDLGRLEVKLERDPTQQLLAEYSRLYGRALELDHRTIAAEYPGRDPGALGDPATAGPAARGGRAASALETLHEQTDDSFRRLLTDRSPAAVAAARASLERYHSHAPRLLDDRAHTELRAARGDLRSLMGLIETEAAPSGGLPPHLAIRWSNALARYNRAETAIAERLGAAQRCPPDPSRASRLQALLEQLRQGDLSPQTLARVRRETAVQQQLSGRPRPPVPDPPPPVKASLMAAVMRYRVDRADLQHAARRLTPSLARRLPTGPARDVAVDRLHAAVTAYQRSAADLNRLTLQYRAERLLPPSYFLRHPDFRNAPHRALATWAAHAVRRGVPPADVPERLGRITGPRSVVPRFTGPTFLLSAARSASRWLGILALTAVREEVHER